MEIFEINLEDAFMARHRCCHSRSTRYKLKADHCWMEDDNVACDKANCTQCNGGNAELKQSSIVPISTGAIQLKPGSF